MVQRRIEVGRQEGVVGVDDRTERHERQRRLRRTVLDPREAVRELDRLLGRLQHERRELDHLVAEHLGGALDSTETGDGELARVRPREAGMRVEPRVVPAPDVHLVDGAPDDVGHHLRRGRLVALPLGHRPQRDDDLAEDVELGRRRLVVARELQLRVEEL